tara:strand:- start:332 stop:532 length:201 start_codon:yes stop_codon:yes gene_type:complete
MKGFEIKLLSVVILALLFLIVTLGMSLEKTKNDLDIERHNETSSEDVPTVSDSLSIRRDSSLERLR